MAVDRGRPGKWRRFPTGGQTPFPASSAEDHPVLAARWADHQASAYVVATHATSRGEGVDAVQIGMPDLVGASPVTPLRPVVGQVNLGGAVVHPGGDLIVSFYSMPSGRTVQFRRVYDGD